MRRRREALQTVPRREHSREDRRIRTHALRETVCRGRTVRRETARAASRADTAAAHREAAHRETARAVRRTASREMVRAVRREAVIRTTGREEDRAPAAAHREAVHRETARAVRRVAV